MPLAARTRAATATTSSRGCELAEVFRRYGDAYRQTHRLASPQRKAMRAITACRTAVMGGQRRWCQRCGFERFVYHSCRNRHCPKCQSQATAAWVRGREDDLLPVPYFHNVFTLPHELNALILYSERNQRALLKLLFDAAAQTLLEFGRRELGGKIGFTLVLHTWDQQLRPHFHIHALLASGALADDGARWIAGGRQFLFPVRGLSKMFRAKYLDGLAELLAGNQLDVPAQLVHLSLTARCRGWLRRLRKKPWVVYSQRPFRGPRKLLDYLGRYTHRVAISNHRLLACDNGQVRFTWRDRRDGDRRKQISLPAEEFIRRFLMHVLPDRFMRVRHYGLLANRGKRERLAQVRRLLGVGLPPKPREEPPQTAAQWLQALLGIDLDRCPCCGEVLLGERLPPAGDGPGKVNVPPGCPTPWDTS
jgi:predicted Zn-ribbon and HTH transcriptional regulator